MLADVLQQWAAKTLPEILLSSGRCGGLISAVLRMSTATSERRVSEKEYML